MARLWNPRQEWRLGFDVRAGSLQDSADTGFITKPQLLAGRGAVYDALQILVQAAVCDASQRRPPAGTT